MDIRRYAVLVSFELEDAWRAAFLELVRENAAASVGGEPGCRRFDIVEASDGSVQLYEIYDDAEAFAVHLASPHFRAFDEATKAMVRAKRVSFGDVLETGE